MQQFSSHFDCLTTKILQESVQKAYGVTLMGVSGNH